MKKIVLFSIALIIRLTALAQEQTLLKQVGDSYLSLQAANKFLNKAGDLGGDISGLAKPFLVYDYTQTYRYSMAKNAYKFGLLPAGVVNTIPPAKGNTPMNYIGTPNPTLGMPYITKDGLLFIQNQANVRYSADILNAPGYPTEIWFVWYKPDYFMWEKYFEEPFYAGDMGGANGFRFTNDNSDDHQFAKSVQPVNRAAIYRIRATQINNKTDYINVELWIDGVKQTNKVAVTAWYRKYFTLEVGAETNNAYVGWAEIFNTPVLTDDQALRVTQELQAEYKPFNLPIATDLRYTVDKAKNLTVSYKYNGKLTKGRVKTKWVDMKGGPAKSMYRPEYDNKLTVPANFRGRVEITVSDIKGNYFGIPSTKYFNN